MLKHIFTLLLLILILGSCKKDFATFQNSNSHQQYSLEKSILCSKNYSLTSSNSISSEINEENILNKKPELIPEDKISDEIFIIKTPLEQKAKIEPTKKFNKKNKTILVQKSILKRGNKINDATQENTQKIDVVSLLSTIFGGLGLLLMFSGIGWLFGLTGMILGIIGLKRKTNNKTLAILGIVLGSISTLIGLLIVILIASFISANI